MPSRSATAFWVLPLMASMACGGRSTQSPDGTAGGGSVGARAEDCTSYADQAEHAVEVRITNSTGQALYFGSPRPGSGPTPPFELRDAADGFLSLPNVEPCPASCADVMAATGDCRHPTPIESARRLLPKGTMHQSWPGTFLVSQTLSVACQPSGATVPVWCRQAVAAPAGAYTFEVRAGTDIHCNGSECAECAADDDECFIPGGIRSGSEHSAKVTVNLDAGYGLSSAGGAAPTSLPAVQLTFEP